VPAEKLQKNPFINIKQGKDLKQIKKRPFDNHFTNGEIKLMVTPINLLLV